MEPFKGTRKVKILDYYSMIETDHAVSPAAEQRIPLRGLCKICFRPIRGSHRVKSNFICHLKRVHPDVYAEFEVLTGRKRTMMSIASLDEPEGMVGTIDYSNSNGNHIMSMDLTMAALTANSASTSLPMTAPASLTPSSALPHGIGGVATMPMPLPLSLPAAKLNPTLSASTITMSTPATINPLPSTLKGEILDLTGSLTSSPDRYEDAKDLDHMMATSAAVGAATAPIHSSVRIPASAPIPTSALIPASVRIPASVPTSASIAATHTARSASGGQIRRESQQLNDALLDFVIGNVLPVEVIGSREFHRLFAVARHLPHYSIPSANQLQQMLLSKALVKKGNIIEKLKAVDSFYLSEEPWQSWVDGKTYVNISVHFIHKWSLKHILVLCKAVDCTDRTYQLDIKSTCELELGEFCSSNVEDTIFNLSHKLALPGFSNTVKSYISNSFTKEGKQHYSCFTYELGNAILCTLKDPSQVKLLTTIRKCTKLFSTGKINWGREVNIAATKEWYDQLELLDLVLNMEDYRRQELAESVSAEDQLDEQEVDEIRTMLEIIKPFGEVVKHFHSAGATTSTSSLAVPYHRLLIQTNSEREARDGSNLFLSTLSRNFIQQTEFVEEGNRHPTIYTTATSLDPRFKLRWCEDEHYELYKDHLVTLANKAMSVKTEPTTSTSAANGPTYSVFAKILKQSSQSTEDVAVATEVLRYLREPLVGEDSDVLKFWEYNHLSYPHLSILANKYLAIPTSSADVSNSSADVSNSHTLARCQGASLQGASANQPIYGNVIESLVQLRSQSDLDWYS